MSHGLALGVSCVWSRGPQAPLPESLQGQRKPELQLLGADVRLLNGRDDREAFWAPVWGPVAGGALVQSATALGERLSTMQDAGLRRKTAHTVVHTYTRRCCNHLFWANYKEGELVDGLKEVLQLG